MSLAADDADAVELRLQVLAQNREERESLLSELDDLPENQEIREQLQGEIESLTQMMGQLVEAVLAATEGLDDNDNVSTDLEPHAGFEAAAAAAAPQFGGGDVVETSVLHTPVALAPETDIDDLCRTVSGAAPIAANALRTQVYAEKGGLLYKTSKPGVYARLPHLVNTEFDFELPNDFGAPKLLDLHRKSLVGLDYYEVKTTRVLELFDTVAGSRLVPLGTDGDGDCLLHSASIGLWGVHWERSNSEGQKGNLDGTNHFSPDTSPMRTAMLKCQEFDGVLFNMAWVGEHVKQLQGMEGYAADALSDEDRMILSRVTFVCPHAKFDCIAFHPKKGVTEAEFDEATAELMARCTRECTMVSLGYTVDGRQCLENRELGQVHIFNLSMALRRPVIVYSNSYTGRSEENFCGIYLPGGQLPMSAWATRRPLLLHGGRQHYTALVAVQGVTSRVPLFIADPVNPHDPESEMRVSPVPLRFFWRGGPIWRGNSTAWATEPGGLDVLQEFVGEITTETLPSGESVHFLDLAQYEKHQPPLLSTHIAETYVANLKRQGQRVQKGDGQSRCAHDFWDALDMLNQALLLSSDIGPDNSSVDEMREWLAQHAELARAAYEEGTLSSPTVAAAAAAPFAEGGGGALPTNASSDAEAAPAPAPVAAPSIPSVHSHDGAAGKGTPGGSVVEEANQPFNPGARRSPDGEAAAPFFGGGRPDVAMP